jgi:uncharacterized protein
MSQVLYLYRLQLLDTQKDQITARLTSIHQKLNDDQDVQAARLQKEVIEQDLKLARNTLRQAEESVQRQNIKIQQSEAALYGGKVRNPKELQDLQDEVASLKRHLVTLEDHQLDAMLLSEDLEGRQEEALSKLADAEITFVNQHSSLIAEKERLERDIERIEAERQAISGAILDANIKQYHQLRLQRRGIAVATISDDCCSACGAELTPADRQAARSPQRISYCSTCGRILYAG